MLVPNNTRIEEAETNNLLSVAMKCSLPMLLLCLLAAPSACAQPVTGLPLEEARICITGYDHNRPDPFPGLGDFIGWVGDIVRLNNGDLLFTHSAGYWHVSFATPIVLSEDLVESYKKAGLDLNHEAPTGGRIMACRSSDNGETWTKPELVYDGDLDAGPSATCVTGKGTVIQIINVQASWYGFPEAPDRHQKLNTRQLYIRSTDHGHTWSEPKPLESSGTYYTRGRSRILQLPDGGLLWMSYDMNKGGSLLDGTIHRSDDDGRTWRIVSIIRRRKPVDDQSDTERLVVSGDVDRFLKLGSPTDDQWIDTDEGDLGRLSSGRLVLVVRPDGGILVSDDQAQSWKQIGRIGPEYVYAPHMVVLADDTLVLTAGGSGGQCIFLSTDGGKSWSKPITIDPSVYGYGKLTCLEDESIFLAYVQRHSAPQRCMLVRFRVNKSRDGVELLAIGD
ncbi:MAG: exo-alpha-sialidase [Planctomycetota bacterium]|nr:MAG: exo-alpha-sialidase [Planctomycetota bacterium]